MTHHTMWQAGIHSEEDGVADGDALGDGSGLAAEKGRGGGTECADIKGWGIKQPIACCNAMLLRNDMPPCQPLGPFGWQSMQRCNGGIH